MAHRLLFRSNRLLFGSLTKMQKVGSTMTHSYRQFSNKSVQSGQAGTWNKLSHIAVGGCIAGGVLGGAYGIYSGIEKWTLGSKTGRAFAVIPTVVVLGSSLVAGYFAISHMLPEFVKIYRSFMVTTMITLAVGGTIYIFWGEKYATQYLRMEAFLRDPRIIQKARTSMKSKKLTGIKNEKKLLTSRSNDSLELCAAIKALVGNGSYLIVSGMKEGGKTTLAEDVVIKLKKEGIPTVYIQVGKNDKGAFLKNCAKAFGIADEVSGVLGKKLEWDDVSTIIERACGEQGSTGKDAKGNVIIFDNVSKQSPCLGEIDNLARMMGQQYPKTAVVIVASDATDVFYTRPELRRRIKTLMPFNSVQIKEFLVTELKVSDELKTQYKNGEEVQESDASRMVDIISTSYSPSLVAIENLVQASRNKDKSINFEEAESYVKAQTAGYAEQIRELCGDEATRKSLKKFVQENTDEPFGISVWRDKFGSIFHERSFGYRLLFENLLFYQIEKRQLRFHAPMIRQAISDMSV